MLFILFIIIFLHCPHSIATALAASRRDLRTTHNHCFLTIKYSTTVQNITLTRYNYYFSRNILYVMRFWVEFSFNSCTNVIYWKLIIDWIHEIYIFFRLHFIQSHLTATFFRSQHKSIVLFCIIFYFFNSTVRYDEEKKEKTFYSWFDFSVYSLSSTSETWIKVLFDA